MLVVPTSRRMAPLTAMISGMRKLPPISMSWPRDTITSLPGTGRRRAITVAAALLLTAVGRLRAGQAADPFADRRLPGRAFAGLQIQLEIEIAARRLARRLGGCLGDRGAAKVGVQHDAGGVDDRPEFRP